MKQLGFREETASFYIHVQAFFVLFFCLFLDIFFCLHTWCDCFLGLIARVQTPSLIVALQLGFNQKYPIFSSNHNYVSMVLPLFSCNLPAMVWCFNSQSNWLKFGWLTHYICCATTIVKICIKWCVVFPLRPLCLV